MEKILKFPKDFLWGTANSAYQIEGGIENCDWAKDFSAGKSCDHYNLYEKDFDLMKSLNQNAYRFSIEWSRIEPEAGKFNKKEIEHYQKVLEALKSRKIKTMVTLSHFTLPLWLAERGGWSSRKIIFYFPRFAKKIFDEFQDLVDFWITINEPLVYASFGYLEGRWPPHQKNLILFLKTIKNQETCHKKIYRIFHTFKPETRVGIAKNNSFFEPFNKESYLDKFSTKLYSFFGNEYFLNQIKNYLDFIGLNYYFHQKIKFPFAKKETENQKRGKRSDIGWEIYPPGIYYTLGELKKYNLPIYITENGVADAQDKLRQDFIENHLYWIWQAIEEWIDVRGYFYWSLMDSFEWEKRFEPRFGLIEIDYKTFERKPRPSALYYAQICKDNQLITNR